MRHFAASGHFLPDGSPAVSWGDWTIYVEVGDDQLAVRQINRFQNGNVVCYDKGHQRDEFGYLVGLRFSLKPKWRKFFPDAEVISATEFDAEWRRSLNSPNCVNRGRAKFPQFDVQYLAAVVAALRARSRGITYHCPGWTCTREIEQEDSSERLNVDLVDIFEAQWRLSVWSDQSMWFRVCRGSAKNGWDFILSFHGDCKSVPPEQIVDLLKESLAMPSYDLLDIWRSVRPQVERSESKT